MQAGIAVPGQTAAAAGSGEFRRPSRFADAPPDKRPGGFQDAPPRPSGSSDSRSSLQGYGLAPNSAALAQSGVGDFRGMQDKMQYLGSQSSGGAGTDARQAATPSFSQTSPGGMAPYAKPPPTSAPAFPSQAFGTSGPHWAGAMPLSTSNGQQDWRPGGFGRPSGTMPDYHNPMQHQQRLPGNWQTDAMPYSRFH